MANVSSSNSQKALVPKLRFPGFEGEWENRRMDELFTEIIEKNHTDYPVLSILQGSGTVLRDNSDRRISYDKNNLNSYKLLERGDFIIHLRSFEGGLECSNHVGIVSPAYKILRTKLLLPEAYKDYFRSYRFVQGKLSIAVTGIRDGKNIDMPSFWEISIAIPKLAEQKKIAAFMNLLERRIDAQRRLVEALKSYKRGVLSAVFDEDNCILKIDRASWKQYKIGDFLFPRISKQVPTPDAPLMAFTAEGGVCPKGDRYDRSFLVKDENKQYKRTELNDFIYSSNNLDVGSIGLNKYGSAVISDVYEIFTIKGADISFITEAICRPQTIAKILKYRQGVIYGQYRIYAEKFLEVDVCLPPIKEQIIYSQLFSKLDGRIVHENTLLKDLSEIKLGLLQRLFI